MTGERSTSAAKGRRSSTGATNKKGNPPQTPSEKSPHRIHSPSPQVTASKLAKKDVKGKGKGSSASDTKSGPSPSEARAQDSPQKPKGQEPNLPTTVRLHISGLNPEVSEADIRARFATFGEVVTVDGWPAGTNALGDPLTYAFLTLKTTHGKLSRCLSILNNAAWRGSKLRIGEAKAVFSERLRKESEEAAKSGWKAPTREEAEAKFKLVEGGRILSLDEVQRTPTASAADVLAAVQGKTPLTGTSNEPESDSESERTDSEASSGMDDEAAGEESQGEAEPMDTSSAADENANADSASTADDGRNNHNGGGDRGDEAEAALSRSIFGSLAPNALEPGESGAHGAAPFSILGGLALDDVEMDDDFDFGRVEDQSGVPFRVDEAGDADAAPAHSFWKPTAGAQGIYGDSATAGPLRNAMTMPLLFPRFEGVEGPANGTKKRKGARADGQRVLEERGLVPVPDERNPAHRLLFRDLTSGVHTHSERVPPFQRTETLDAIEERWKSTRRELTQEYKRRHREAVKKQRRRVVGSRATGGVVGLKGH